MYAKTLNKHSKKSLPVERVDPKCVPSCDAGIVSTDSGGAYFMNKKALLNFMVWLQNETLSDIPASPKYYVDRYLNDANRFCKWQGAIGGKGNFPDCLPFGEHFEYQSPTELIYCPFCGKEIKRVN